jgi:DNA helicase-2/ATP-dependent DNA helicase PcrA
MTEVLRRHRGASRVQAVDRAAELLARVGITAPGLRLGARVRHPKFGEGVVLNVEGQGAHARVNVNFATEGAKWLVVSMAKLESV